MQNFIHRINQHKGGLVRFKHPLYRGAMGGWDKEPIAVCTLIDVEYRYEFYRYPIIPCTLGATLPVDYRPPTVIATVLVGDSITKIKLTSQDIELIDEVVKLD